MEIISLDTELIPSRIAEMSAVRLPQLGNIVFDTDEETLEQEAVIYLIEKKLTLAVAESCTGGLLAHRITSVPGCSAVFLAGIVAYSNEAKIKLLGVPRELIESHGAVSQEVARAMASGVRAAIGTDIGMGITGIAGPGGGTPTKPVGLMYIAISTEITLVSQEFRFIGSRAEIKERGAQTALTMLMQRLLNPQGKGAGC